MLFVNVTCELIRLLLILCIVCVLRCSDFYFHNCFFFNKQKKKTAFQCLKRLNKIYHVGKLLNTLVPDLVTFELRLVLTTRTDDMQTAKFAYSRAQSVNC